MKSNSPGSAASVQNITTRDHENGAHLFVLVKGSYRDYLVQLKNEMVLFQLLFSCHFRITDKVQKYYTIPCDVYLAFFNFDIVITSIQYQRFKKTLNVVVIMPLTNPYFLLEFLTVFNSRSHLLHVGTCFLNLRRFLILSLSCCKSCLL